MDYLGTDLIGRDQELEEYARFQQGDDRVLAYWGVAGHGKSTLLEYLSSSNDTGSHILDLEYLVGRRNSAPALGDVARTLLDEIADVLSSWCGRELPQYSRAAADADKDERSLLSRRVSIEAKISARGSSFISNSPITLNAGSVTEPLAHLRAINRGKLVRALCADLHATDLSGRVLFVDTAERLYYLDDLAYYEASGGASKPDEIGHWFTNRFLPALLNRAKGLKVVLAGREDIKLQPGVKARHVEVKAWEAAASDAYLKSCGEFAKSFRQAIYRLCQGHPGWTSMMVDAVNILGWSEQDMSSLERLARSRPAEEWLPGVFLERIPECRRAAVVTAAVLRSVRKEPITALVDESVLADTRWFEKLTGYSFVQLRRGPKECSSWYVHPLIRGAALSYLGSQEPIKLRAWHSRAADYFMYAGLLEEELYHRFSAGDLTREEDWHNLFRTANLACDYESALRAVELVTIHEVREVLLETTPQLVGHALALQADIALHQGRLEEAIDDAESALQIARSRSLRQEEAKALFILGCIAERRSELNKALNLLTKGFEICLEINDIQNGANCQLHLGAVAARQADYSSASEHFNNAARLYHHNGDILGEGNVH